jgi:5-methylcytosine-specific restriction endonuclease McrA
VLAINLIGRKKCPKCRTTRYRSGFSYCTEKRDGLMANCRQCCSERGKRQYEANRESVCARTRAYKRANAEHKKQVDAAWRAENRERWCEITASWRNRNPERWRSFYERWTSENRDKIRQWSRQTGARRRSRLRAHDPINITAEQWTQRKSVFGDRCAYCGAPESSDAPLAMDHVKPLFLGGRHMLSNVRPACRRCNSRKGHRRPSDWFELLASDRLYRGATHV